MADAVRPESLQQRLGHGGGSKLAVLSAHRGKHLTSASRMGTTAVGSASVIIECEANAIVSQVIQTHPKQHAIEC